MSDVPGGDANEVVVRYGVKELLALQGKTLERIEAKVDQNASTAMEALAKFDVRLSMLEPIVHGLEPRVKVLESAHSEGSGRRGLVTVGLPILLTLIFIVVGVLGLVLHR